MARIFFSILEDIIRYISGPLGIIIRRIYYQKRLKKCGKGVIIDTGVYFTNPKEITLGEHIWIDKNVHLIAGKSSHNNIKELNVVLEVSKGEIVIGNYAHIGINTIIQGHGGIIIGDYFTSSANCCIYSMSNNVYKCHHGTYNFHTGDIYYIMSPIIIENNVWLGIGVSVLGGKISSNVFIKPKSIVMESIEENSIAGGFPALKIKKRFFD